MIRTPFFLSVAAGLALAGLVGAGAADQAPAPRPQISPRPQVPKRPQVPARPQPKDAAAPKYALQVTGAKHVAGTWRVEVYTKDFPATEWMFFFPVAPELDRQKAVKTTAQPEGVLTKEVGRGQRPMLALSVKGKDGQTPQTVALAVRYEATLLARRLVPLRTGEPAPAVPPPDARENFSTLASTPSLDFRSETFQSWIDNNRLRREKAEDEVDFARRAFTAMVAVYKYKEGVAFMPVSKACDLAELDCDTLSAVFVSAMRANGVRARVVFGWPARTIKPDAKGIVAGHAQAEFLAPGVGWVPVDLANALGAKANRKDPTNYFGEDNGNLLVAQVDPDYVVRNPGGFQPVNSMHPGPSTWSRGPKKPDTHYRPKIWEAEVKTVPIPRGG
jgi:transglutaminase-like putative cysteine protease